MTMDCCFCKEYKAPLQSQFYKEIGYKLNCPSRILLETSNWFAVPTIGSLTAGYVLLVHKQHYLSLADVPYSSYEEMLSLKKHIESVLAECLGLDCVTFEHGTSNPFSKGANSVDHVHIHIVPFERPIWQDIVSTISPLSIKDIDNYERLYQEWQSIHPDSYLLFQDTNQKIYYIPDASNMPSQLFRKCLAPHLAAPCWNWKNEAYIDNMMRTMALFKRNG